jgi:hypothetical protein
LSQKKKIVILQFLRDFEQEENKKRVAFDDVEKVCPI